MMLMFLSSDERPRLRRERKRRRIETGLEPKDWSSACGGNGDRPGLSRLARADARRKRSPHRSLQSKGFKALTSKGCGPQAALPVSRFGWRSQPKSLENAYDFNRLELF
jgi:hypothetical protein